MDKSKFASVCPFSFSLKPLPELLPYEQVNIHPKIKGFIKKIYVDRGSHVTKGQLLAQLEAPEIGEQFAASQSATGTAYQKYLFSKQSYDRLKEASKKNGAVASIELERAYAQLLGDGASYKSSKSVASASGQIKNYLKITAPFSGVITGRFMSEGALVGDNAGKGEPLFKLAQQNRLRLTVGIPEKQTPQSGRCCDLQILTVKASRLPLSPSCLIAVFCFNFFCLLFTVFINITIL